MSRPWMPFYVGDYLRDTGRLSTLQHGAYLLLIMDYWVNGSLPDDDEQLAHIARVSEKDWLRMKPVISRLFKPGWKHKRIDEELAKAADVSERRRENASKRWNKRDANASANASPNDDAKGMHRAGVSPSQPPSLAEPKGSAAASEPPPLDLKKSCEEAAGASYPRGFGLIEEAAASGISVQDRILPVIRETAAFARKRGKTIDSWAFFEKPIKDSAVHTHAPPGKGGKTWVKIGTPQFDAWNVWYQDTHGKSAPQSRKGGWYFPSEFPPAASFPASDVREERVKT